jgi:hypothetical protein
VRRGDRVVHGDKELSEKLGRNDLCPCGSERRFQEMLPALRPLRRERAELLRPRLAHDQVTQRGFGPVALWGVAQLAARRILTPQAAGSIPASPTILLRAPRFAGFTQSQGSGELAERQGIAVLTRRDRKVGQVRLLHSPPNLSSRPHA